MPLIDGVRESRSWPDGFCAQRGARRLGRFIKVGCTVEEQGASAGQPPPTTSEATRHQTVDDGTVTAERTICTRFLALLSEGYPRRIREIKGGASGPGEGPPMYPSPTPNESAPARLAAQWLGIRPNGGQGICQLVHGLFGDCGFRSTRLAPTTGTVDLKDDCLVPEPDDSCVNVSSGRVEDHCVLRG